MHENSTQFGKVLTGWVFAGIVVVIASWAFGNVVVAGGSEVVRGIVLTGQFVTPFVFAWLIVKMLRLEEKLENLRAELGKRQAGGGA